MSWDVVGPVQVPSIWYNLRMSEGCCGVNAADRVSKRTLLQRPSVTFHFNGVCVCKSSLVDFVLDTLTDVTVLRILGKLY